jgi:hypothetical protein
VSGARQQTGRKKGGPANPRSGVLAGTDGTALVGVHRLCVEPGGFCFEGIDVAPAQFEGVACLLDGGACPAVVRDPQLAFAV